MKFLYVLWCCLFYAKVYSQTYTPLLDDWNEWHLTNCFFGCTTDVYYTDGDTLVNGKMYKILDGYHYINRNLLLREDIDAKKVFLTLTQPQFQEDILVYDFSLNEGDSIQMRNPLTPFPANDGYFKLDSIRHFPQNGEEKKHFYFSPTISNTSLIEQAVWVEGVGSLSLINAPGGEPDFNAVGQLNCAFKNAELFYSNLDSIEACHPLQLNLSQHYQEKIELLQTHEKNVFTLQPASQIKEVFVFGIDGRLREKITVETSVLQLNLTHYAKGIYLLKLKTTNNQKQNLKLIVK